MRYIVVGTAGHIDHGKTELMKVLTGINTDRLAEEKERGISIELGFAYKKISSDNIIAFIDVPGHKKFIKTMVSGVCGIDYCLFIVAADEGIMPQTKEHFSILNILGVKRGCVVITKSDLIDKKREKEVIKEVNSFISGTFLEKSAIFLVSAKTKKGIKELEDHLKNFNFNKDTQDIYGSFRMPVDRSFAIKGFGTVVTGTVLNGKLKKNDTVYIYPTKKIARVRNIEIHESSSDKVLKGMRAALNFSGIDHNEIKKGYIIMDEEKKEVFEVHARIHILKDAYKLKHSETIRINIATEEIDARVLILDNRKEIIPGTSAPVRLKFNKPTIVVRNDKFVFMKNAFTNGGGIIIDCFPQKYKKNSDDILNSFSIMEKNKLEDIINLKLDKCHLCGKELLKLSEELNIEKEYLHKYIKELKKEISIYSFLNSFYYISNSQKNNIIKRIDEVIIKFHNKNKLEKSFSLSKFRSAINYNIPLSVFEEICKNMDSVEVKDNKLSKKDHSIVFSLVDQKIVDELLKIIENSVFSPPLIKVIEKDMRLKRFKIVNLFKALCEMKKIVKINEDIYISYLSYEDLLKKVKYFFNSNKEMKVSDFKNIVKVSRKYALPLLEFLDNKNITIRRDNLRYLKK